MKNSLWLNKNKWIRINKKTYWKNKLFIVNKVFWIQKIIIVENHFFLSIWMTMKNNVSLLSKAKSISNQKRISF